MNLVVLVFITFKVYLAGGEFAVPNSLFCYVFVIHCDHTLFMPGVMNVFLNMKVMDVGDGKKLPVP